MDQKSDEGTFVSGGPLVLLLDADISGKVNNATLQAEVPYRLRDGDLVTFGVGDQDTFMGMYHSLGACLRMFIFPLQSANSPRSCMARYVLLYSCLRMPLDLTLC